jgi:formylglycine-generating enzyme required for sulfatase activity
MVWVAWMLAGCGSETEVVAPKVVSSEVEAPPDVVATATPLASTLTTATMARATERACFAAAARVAAGRGGTAAAPEGAGGDEPALRAAAVAAAEAPCAETAAKSAARGVSTSEDLAAQVARVEADKRARVARCTADAAARALACVREARRLRARAEADAVAVAPLRARTDLDASERALVDAFSAKWGLPTVKVGAETVHVGTVDLFGGYPMVRVSSGTFTMGSPEGEAGRDGDEVQHRVTLSRAYAIGVTEVTQGLWAWVMGTNPSHFQTCGADCPVENVSWCDAVVFANRLSELEGLTPAYANAPATTPADACEGVTWSRDADGYRLPTEAEWEHAARAGTRSIYAGGDELDAVGWFDGNSDGKTHRVSQKRANAWGVYDMSGNVWEWTWDEYGAYPGAVTDPMGATDGARRVYRGGGWYDGPRSARVAHRGSYDPGSRIYDLGVRLSRTVP